MVAVATVARARAAARVTVARAVREIAMAAAAMEHVIEGVQQVLLLLTGLSSSQVTSPLLCSQCGVKKSSLLSQQ